MKKNQKWMIVLLLLMLTGSLSGCSVPNLVFSPQELYELPELPVKYTELTKQLNAILDSGAEYAAPTSGTNIQPVQLVDLDGDRREEAIAFFRNPEEEKPLKIYIFTAEGDHYERAELIEGSGTGIYSVSYQDLDGDGRLELAVGWKAAADLQVLEIYALHNQGAEVLIRTNYVKYTTADLNQDQRQEVVVFRANDDGDGIADYYNWQADGSLASQVSAKISATMAELSQLGRVTHGKLRGEVPALFVTGVTDTARAITDILTVRNGELTNIVLSELTGVSSEIASYCTLYPSDINGDGLTEVPRPTPMLSLAVDGLTYQRMDWSSYDEQGTPEVTVRTYHNLEDKWYLRLPDEWLNGIWISRSVVLDEAITTFYILEEDGLVTTPFLRISTVAGANREIKAVRGNRFVLSRQSETIYTAELLEANGNWEHGVTPDEVRSAFSLITKEWVAGDN